MWMDYIHRNTSCGMIEGYIISPLCPYDYCFPASTQVYINLTKEGGADSQCAFNHSGLLHGACKPGFSVALGTSRCLQCSNNWLSLLIPFCIAGIVLVISILIFDLTVSNGTVCFLFKHHCCKSSRSYSTHWIQLFGYVCDMAQS